VSKTCCGYICKQGQQNGEYGVWCEYCGKRGKGKTLALAEVAFDASTPGIVVLDDARKLPSYIASHATDLAQIAAPFVRSDLPAFTMMVKKNARYVQSLTGKAYDETWTTKEGQESWLAALEDALILGATLPDMGCIVPFGKVVEFIPDVEAYRFAVTTGSSAPFESLEIEPIYEKDQYKISRKDGNFSIDFTSIQANRGNVIAIAVYGKHKATGRVIGEVYPVDRLIEKARAHSISYRQYLQDVAAFEAAKIEGKTEHEEGREYVWRSVKSKSGDKWHDQDVALFQSAEKDGKLKKDAGGEYTEKTIPGKDGKPDWKKKLYRSDIENPGTEKRKVYFDELHNPYEGADRPEMLRKLAGKSFLAPYIKTRNSTAAINELSADDDVSSLLDGALDAAFEVVPGDAVNVTAEVIADEAFNPDPRKPVETKDEEVVLFGE